MSNPRAPASLGPAGRRLWREILAVYELSPAELEMLRQACRTADLIERADGELLDAPSLVVRGSTGQDRGHPLLVSVADQRRTLDVLIRSLGLPMPSEHEGRRRSPAATAAAQARWRQRRAGHG